MTMALTQHTQGTDESLLTAWQAGDRSAGMQLISRHYDAIVRFFRTKAPREAEDLVQRTFLACSESAARFQGDGTFRAFLFGIARNILYEHIRHAMRAGRHVDFHALSVADIHHGVSTEAAKRAETRILLRALQLVPIESQMLLELFYWEELSVNEVAEALDIPVGTVKSRLHRAREQLRGALPEAPTDAEDPRSGQFLLEQWLGKLDE
ncbi:MAG: sigma-70 family RNA polymerase sigma factor [Deltaproteobacteria bacterium]|nr:MAG: sigma-70 family RNA polymerase sigma factor [Deltaproteobacteria bacterium]